ncbi:furin-1-like isoform X1 [Ptychodera flava]|uniref:furin-1-like isoform X1 n=1 Tax=Ptychodera flava TaxID=63121 RepID=UPI003969EEBE
MELQKLLRVHAVIVVVLSILHFIQCDIYTNKWAVHVYGGKEEADRLAEKYGIINLGEIIPEHYHFMDRRVHKRSARATNARHHILLQKEPSVRWLEQQISRKRVKRDLFNTNFNDDKWPLWYLKRKSGPDMNIIPAWQKGYSGKDVVVSILDDGIEKDHPDLKKNYDQEASHDVNGGDDDPSPRYDPTNENKHGTRCAGEVAAEANNKVCSVGAAFNAKIGGVRMLDGDVTDAVEAQSLSLNPQHIDIYSASWGPDDDGKTVDGPARLAKQAFVNGVTKGRGGLGSIFVWASGNGGRQHDSCSCDGYTNSIFTLSISSVSEKGAIPWYSESCSSTLATTYSSGSGNEREVITTDLHHGCTDRHSGTSASAPLAAGICALALEANPKLTWRDLQYIVVITSRSENLNSADWKTNGAGYHVSHAFGFGLMDATAMVEYAEKWITVPEQHICEEQASTKPAAIPSKDSLILKKTTVGCENSKNHVLYLEHVQARLTMTYSRRGDLEIYLTSPSGTRSLLLPQRSRDSDTRDGFKDWPFMTTHCWGERSRGTWILEIKNKGSPHNSGMLKDWKLVLYGTDVDPLQSYRAVNETISDTDMDCPMGFYVATKPVNNTISDYQCVPCDRTCRTCSGKGPNRCLSCHFFYHKRDTTCVFIQQLSFIAKGTTGYYVLAIMLCLAAVSIFFIIFGCLQARSHGWCCWSSKSYGKVTMSNYKGLNISDGDYLDSVDEDEDNSEDIVDEFTNDVSNNTSNAKL